MRIDELTLTNFDGFDHRTFDFNPGFTLLVGDNATGKTSVLDALAIAVCSWFLGLRGIETSRGIDSDEVRMVAHPHADSYTFEKQFPARIECTGFVMGRKMQWARELQREGGRTTTSDAKRARKNKITHLN
jgi:DNA repair exonuclease SbcCD ATPase subunit